MTWTKEDFDRFYDIGDRFKTNRTGARIGYGREFAQYVSRTSYQMYRDRITALVNRSAYSPGNRVLVVGCGFGYLMSMMLEAGAQLSRVWGTDLSAWIHTNKATEQHENYLLAANILDIDITLPNALDLLKTATGINNLRFDWVITEDVIEMIPGVDRPDFYSSCEALLPNNGGGVAHFVGTDYKDAQLVLDYGITEQSLADWSLEAPSHYWIDSNSLDAIVPGG